MEGTSSWTSTEELFPRIGISWKMSFAIPATQLVDPLGVHSRPIWTVALALPRILISSTAVAGRNHVEPEKFSTQL